MRRRRRLSETYTLFQCRSCQNMAQDMPCVSPLIDVFPLLTMNSLKDPSVDTTELASPSDKYIVFDGAKFQLEYHSNPADWDQCNNLPPLPDVNQVTMVVTVWEAIMVLPLQQGTAGTPAYLPIFTAPGFQQGDLADRVLWKRLSHIPLWGTGTTGGVPQLESTVRDEGHGPVAVKSRAKLDDRHGLFYIRNFVHNVIFDLATGHTCDLNCDTMSVVKSIPLTTDAWFKLFYHTRK